MLKEKLKEFRIYMSLIILIMGAFPWLEVVTRTQYDDNTDYSGYFEDSEYYDESEFSNITHTKENVSTTCTGYGAIEYSVIGILIFLIPVALIVFEFVPQLNLKLRSIYLSGSLLGAIATIVYILISKAVAKELSVSVQMGAAQISGNIDIKLKFGFWITILMYVAIFVYTLIKDFAISKASISEHGLKALITDVTDELADSMKTISAEGTSMNNALFLSCPKCSVSVMKGKKFCSKCGEKMPESVEQQPIVKFPVKSAKETRMITVREYVANLKAIKCHNCDEMIEASKKFCPNCGEAVQVKLLPEKCWTCGGDILKDRKYCPDCGNEIVPVELKMSCEHCKAELLYGKRYCVDCGAKIK